MSGEHTELYVYYRVAPANWRVALQVVYDFQRRLRGEHPGLAARVLRRAADGSDAVTLMEIYAFTDDRAAGVDAALRSRIEDAATALAPLLTGPRQIEVFNALD
ncbi:MAG TPA: DUF4936 family protein [Burkholderiaceae bacterium]|nr:DUF4936 family protein [Burkholderiaceae bacterium]